MSFTPFTNMMHSEEEKLEVGNTEAELSLVY
jgi:hypothetical protein